MSLNWIVFLLWAGAGVFQIISGNVAIGASCITLAIVCRLLFKDK